ncbi:fatty acid 2-hydroxylase isoform X1 [Lycorma delicatula]|uniref:fatty acid 2-hydroxylase isoform X1 n=1 Tax=Lycorma delicatula TaxID=130591 RepID=UPI003F513380
MDQKKYESLVLRYKGKDHDFARFRKFHPGGSNTLGWYNGKEIGQVLESTHHSKSAYHLIKEYAADKTTKGSEDLEELIDWNQPVLSQVGSLRGNYNAWVLEPVDRKLRLFKSGLLEALTITTWHHVVAFWYPVILLLLYYSYKRLCYPDNYTIAFRVISMVFSFLFGLCLWPLVEYTIHRWLFHLKPPDDSPVLITIHFALHGLHHKVPFDDGRLLFPPGPGSLVGVLGYGLYTLLFPNILAPAILAGTIQGYVIYDLMHFYLHYGSPKEGTYLYEMKRYHNQHHFVQHEKGFGISSSFWDHIFETAITLKELSYSLKW